MNFPLKFERLIQGMRGDFSIDFVIINVQHTSN